MLHRLLWVITLVVTAFAGCSPPVGRPPAHLDMLPADSGAQVSLFALGDTDDTVQLPRVAEAMTRLAGELPRMPDAALLLGDNFYQSLWTTDNPKWRTLFEDMFDKMRLAFPFYAALGNHDYLDKNDTVELDYAKQNPTSRWKMPARWYRVDLPAGAAKPLVTVLVMDSNESDLGEERWEAQKKWADIELSRGPRAPWRIVAAHHPLWSNGVHGDDKQLQEQWGPIFRRHSVDFYVCGHDHTLQQLDIGGWPTTFLVAGGGGAGEHVMLREDRGFSRSTQGFLHLNFTADRAEVHFLDYASRTIHRSVRSRDGRVTITQDGGRDRPWTGKLIGTTPVP